MKTILIFTMFLMLTPLLWSQESPEDAGDQARDAIDYLLGEINRLQGVEDQLASLTEQVEGFQQAMNEIRAEKAELDRQVAELLGIRDELTQGTEDNAGLKSLLSDILKWLEMPANFIQRIRAFGIVVESTD